MVRGILDRGAMPLVLGGDDAITCPVVRACSEPLHVVHFDAHLDYAPFIHDLVVEFLGHICDQPRWKARRERGSAPAGL